jgi:UDP:flavonoid glycosyltransferase YjiC (YdhE family)
MKIGMQTWGSHGDIRPMVALAEGLQVAGHDVTLAITCFDNDQYHNLQSPTGVKLRIVAPLVLGLERTEAVGKAVFNERNPLTQMGMILRLCFEPAEAAMIEAADELCRDADLLIGHFFMYPLQIAAERAGRPYASVAFAHSLIPSRFNPPVGLPALGQLGNRFWWWLLKIGINRQIKKYPQRLREKLGMAPVGDVMTEVWVSTQLTLLGVSPQLCQRPPDWPAHVHACGFLDMPNLALEGEVPVALAAFLQAGAPPVYMTLGSMMPKIADNHGVTLQLLTDAARLAGCRAIIQAALWQECGFAASEQVLYVSAAPHHLIFPHCHAIVHHGGAGTTHSATLAGKPSVMVAHIAEQVGWGEQLRRIGIAGKPLERRNVTVQALAQRIRQVLDSPQMACTAQNLGLAMKQENGVAAAVKLIEQRFTR